MSPKRHLEERTLFNKGRRSLTRKFLQKIILKLINSTLEGWLSFVRMTF